MAVERVATLAALADTTLCMVSQHREIQYAAAWISTKDPRSAPGFHRGGGGMAAASTQSASRRGYSGRCPATAGAPQEWTTYSHHGRR